MAVTTVFYDNDYVGTGSRHYAELQCSTRAEVAEIPTDGYTCGSTVLCVADMSLWVLGYNGDDLEWIEVVL